MAQERNLKTGQVGVANTIYIPKPNDLKAKEVAKSRKVSKSRVLVEAVVKEFPA